MKMITAMIQPVMLSKVTIALEDIESFPGMIVTDVCGFGRLNGGDNQHASSFSDFHPRA